ncbi:hypothetical protein DHEL01_v210253 [Diaporthe helianthi]|uniref:Uncharacterized protein n=1 Tax=Diaporthe helianthi TaxID=158607 RepID=A0A2P5HM90_DIAHE|nr:hypothetical protein DHEL01_v210253 [Diaporthe helianthi]
MYLIVEYQHGAEAPTTLPEESPEIHKRPKQKLRGFAASNAQYLKLQNENPGHDLVLAEDIRREEEHHAAKEKQHESPETYRYFFYGTLVDPTIAQRVLGTEAPPVMRPAILRNRGHLKIVFGVVFAWIGGDDDLHHGEFDLEAYKKAKAELEAADK